MSKFDKPKQSTAQGQSAQQQQPQQNDPDWAPTPQAHSQYKPKEKTNDNEDEEEDEYEKRIQRTGCSAENEALQLCYAEKHDWRACKDAMTAFRECWKRNGNVEAEV